VLEKCGVSLTDKDREGILDEYEFDGPDSFMRFANNENQKPRHVKRAEMIAFEKALDLMPREYLDVVIGGLQLVEASSGAWDDAFRELAAFMSRIIRVYQDRFYDAEDDGKTE